MNFSEAEATLMLKQAETLLHNTNEPAPLRVKRLCWVIMAIRARALTNGIRLLIGDKVYAGPFKNMALTETALSGYQVPILLGCYEHELHDTFEKIIATPYTRILNIGCSVGYYAVGLALRMPKTHVDAFDIVEDARQRCQEMIDANHVGDRVHVYGEFFGKDFEKFENEKTLVVMDIEGAERELLDPQAFPALQKMDVVVEMHDLIDPGLSQKLLERFAPTHTLQVVKNRTCLPDVEGLLPDDYYLSPFDHMLLGWEGRDGNTPWGVFTVKEA